MSTPECLHISAWCNINKHVFCTSLSYIKTYRLNIDNTVIVVHGIDQQTLHTEIALFFFISFHSITGLNT